MTHQTPQQNPRLSVDEILQAIRTKAWEGDYNNSPGLYVTEGKAKLLDFLIKNLPDTETTNEEEYRQYVIDMLYELFNPKKGE